MIRVTSIKIILFQYIDCYFIKINNLSFKLCLDWNSNEKSISPRGKGQSNSKSPDKNKNSDFKGFRLSSNADEVFNKCNFI